MFAASFLKQTNSRIEKLLASCVWKLHFAGSAKWKLCLAASSCGLARLFRVEYETKGTIDPLIPRKTLAELTKLTSYLANGHNIAAGKAKTLVLHATPIGIMESDVHKSECNFLWVTRSEGDAASSRVIA